MPYQATGQITLPVGAAWAANSSAPALTFTTNNKIPGLAFDGGSLNEYCYFSFRLPNDFNVASGTFLEIDWIGTTGVTTGTVRWGAQMVSSAGEAINQGPLDGAVFNTARFVNDAHLGTTGERLHKTSISFPNPNNGNANNAGDFVVLRFYRDANTVATDTYAADATVVGLAITYNTEGF